jgi:protein-L-isoaspartate(D-aspartate) O-methyltransferase
MKPVRVLLLWPGTDGAAAGNFGVPQLVTIASYVRARTGARVDIVDLVCERAFGPVDVPKLLAGPDGEGYDVVGLSCYASYDFLKIEAVARMARAALPDAVIVTGGYHASARPSDFLGEDAPFDAVVVGEGEKPLVKIVERVAAGDRPRGEIFGSDPIEDLDELPPSDWSLLDRYRPVMRKVASQIQLYLSRGCPFDCAFCMERAKREVSWRAFSVERAIDEVRRLAAWADLSGMTVYVADALFGMRPSWRRAFLAALAREKLPVQKIWLLVRVDLVDDEDLRLFGEANCAPGFGLESGDPALLGVIRKAGRLEDYLDRMRRVAARARELDVPWGANVIVGHPGETEATIRTTARYLSELFLDPKGTTGFLSVDPFRLYPGSPIDDERPAWEKRFGTRFHRPEWWKDGDQEFLSEWVDPSESLDYRRRATLMHEQLEPITSRIQANFVYRGPARDYFERAIVDQVRQGSAHNRLHYLGRFYAWHRYVGTRRAGAAILRRDPETAELLRAGRDHTLKRVAAELYPGQEDAARAWLGSPVAAALRDVPRERFVPLDHVLESTRDVPLPLDASGLSTISALHAYARSYALAHVREGSRVLDLGGGTGYGAALLARLVGEAGCAVTVELDPRLCAAARADLGTTAAVIEGDALDAAVLEKACAAAGGPFDAIVCGFAVAALPASWGRALCEGGVVVAPVGEGDSQTLVRATWRDGAFTEETFGDVRYVRARRAADIAPVAAKPAASERRSLRLV